MTHTEHRITPELRERIRAKFESYRSTAGYEFAVPNRVDLLRKPVRA